MQLLKMSLMAGLVLLLAACSSSKYSTKKNLYLKHAQSIPPMRLLPGMSGSKIKTFYTVPAVSAANNVSPSLLPPGSKVWGYQQQMKSKKKT